MGQVNGQARAKRSSVRAPATLERAVTNLRVAPLTSLTPGAAADWSRERERLFEALQQELAATHLLFGIPGAKSWQLQSYVGPDEAGMRAWIEGDLGACTGSPAGSVPRDQRGRPAALQLTAAGASAPAHALRLVISDGPRALACILALRDAEFEAREAELFELSAAPLAAQLLRERQAELAQTGRGLAQGLLESFAEPALVLSDAGWIELCNEPAENWLGAGDREGDLAELRAALRGQAASPRWVLSALDAACPGFALARWRGQARNAPGQVVGLARQAWKLGELQTQVLERVANGESNKEIAKALKRAEVTIERHLTRLFRASGSRCRTELITHLFSLAP